LARLTDNVLLDGWLDEVPPPQVDFVPAAEKDLTIIAAYLVGTPPSPDRSDSARSGPSTKADQDSPDAAVGGLTDFIVGLPQQPANRSDPGTELTDRGSMPSPLPAADPNLPPILPAGGLEDGPE
jgi:hypothetical protein